MTIPALLFRDESDEARGHERYRVRIGAVRIELGADVSDLTVHDVSASGILLETDQELATGLRIAVEFPESVRREAHIVWASNNFYGARFTKELSPTELGRIYAASDVVWPDFGREEYPDPIKLRRGRYIGDTAATAAVETSGDDLGLGSGDKLPLKTRLAVIFGMAGFCWAIIGGGAWLALA